MKSFLLERKECPSPILHLVMHTFPTLEVCTSKFMNFMSMHKIENGHQIICAKPNVKA